MEFQGLLKIFVIQGTNLAIRDMRTSDPYVAATIGDQVRFFFLYIFQAVNVSMGFMIPTLVEAVTTLGLGDMYCVCRD